jgi:hypothetical protein
VSGRAGYRGPGPGLFVRVAELPAGCTTSACQTTVATGLYEPGGVAVAPSPAAPTAVSASPGNNPATVSFTPGTSRRGQHRHLLQQAGLAQHSGHHPGGPGVLWLRDGPA